MRKRLYQPLPEHSELIDNPHVLCNKKTKKRLYAENIVKDHEVKVAGVTEYLQSLDGFTTLAAGQIDAFYELYDCYEKEYLKISQAMYGRWNDTASTSAKFFNWYMRNGISALEKTFELPGPIELILKQNAALFSMKKGD